MIRGEKRRSTCTQYVPWLTRARSDRTWVSNFQSTFLVSADSRPSNGEDCSIVDRVLATLGDAISCSVVITAADFIPRGRGRGRGRGRRDRTGIGRGGDLAKWDLLLYGKAWRWHSYDERNRADIVKELKVQTVDTHLTLIHADKAFRL